MGDNDTIFCQRAEDELQVVISKTFRTSANGICQMPAGNVPIYAMKEVAEAVRGARSNMTPTMKQQLEINGSVSLISGYMRLWGNSQPYFKKMCFPLVLTSCVKGRQ